MLTRLKSFAAFVWIISTCGYDSAAFAAGGLPACVNNDTALCALETQRAHDDADFIAGNIRNGINILGVTGTAPEPEPDCTDDSAIACTLEATRASDDPDFIASNISSGNRILGVTGTYAPGDCKAPASCPAIGDVCADGSIFGGFLLYYETSCQAIYVTDQDQGSGIAWKVTDNNMSDISVDDAYDGQVNADNRAGTLSNFPAFDLCESYTYHGKSDWYLPSRSELVTLFQNRDAIDANSSSVLTGNYWSSSESGLRPYVLSVAVSTDVNMGDYLNVTVSTTKNTTSFMKVRCVRKD